MWDGWLNAALTSPDISHAGKLLASLIYRRLLAERSALPSFRLCDLPRTKIDDFEIGYGLCDLARAGYLHVPDDLAERVRVRMPGSVLVDGAECWTRQETRNPTC